MRGVVHEIHIAPEQGGAVERVDRVDAVAERGLRGDRYFREDGTFSDRDGCDLTLIEREAVTAIEREYDISLESGSHRRNVTTEGVALNHLVGERFRIGDAVCVGEELCEPCSYLERLLSKRGLTEALTHRGGLRARIVRDGTIEAGDPLELE
ncbi:MOSC domain-containing protein [Halobacteria archaeon AArc-m2/3/4]|uniref:MOSC domain-containing protein n=1 Tax=Natronoglomus mannanivorans TaxID=2979990 RepID=A0AAP3E3K7_9EURY|nr:MOSC domain-containing protein [Halobacteria archaeon AArc-xg1-1]MCU4973882.1 MOSC domain-containing protein [Halobacteria archaeon AArc-m2/3/4]